MIGSHLLGGPTRQPWWSARSCQETRPGAGHASACRAGTGHPSSWSSRPGVLDQLVCSGSSCGTVTEHHR